MPKKNAPPSLDDALSDLKANRLLASRCSVCSLEHVDTLNKACLALAERRVLPASDPQSTDMSWNEFYRLYVCKHYPGFRPSDPRRFYRHLESCLGVDRV